ncbi:hypothetical protein B4099_1500 [Heyndrickxia coagulans]|uniref:Uncharacterized protein n=1 Tax=Heyndrickxia coagulans TaxID=1398 RepID=A0A150K8D7_HEYCO|nr:hypothetical protein B4099_1500 [Heyndrickxia coagulans]
MRIGEKGTGVFTWQGFFCTKTAAACHAAAVWLFQVIILFFESGRD